MHSINKSTLKFPSLGLKKTKARYAILHIFDEVKRPLDVAEIVQYLEKHDSAVDQATVYRILDAFHKKGVINQFEFQEGKFRYELAGSDHHHLICENCGRIEDISDCGIDRWEKEIKKRKGFIVKRHALEFFGVCQSCQQ